MLSTVPTKIDIRQFLHLTEYLKELYKHYKSLNSGFTYEAWSADIGYKSRGFMKLITSGKRKPTTDFVENFAQKTNLSHFEKSYLFLIAKYEIAEKSTDRDLYLDKIFALRGEFKDQAFIESHEEFLKSVHTPKIQVLLSFVDIEKSVENLSQILSITPEESRESLNVLAKLGLAQQDSKTSLWKATEKSYKVVPKMGNEALIHYHNMSMHEAMSAQKLPSDIRKLRSTLLPLNHSEFEQLMADIEQLISKSVAKYDRDDFQGRSLYKMNVQLFPASKVAEK